MHEKHLLSATVFDYLIANSVKESPPHRALREFTEKLPEHDMMATPDEAQFLAWLVRLTQATRIIEVGVFTGYTTLAMAEVLPDTGNIIACDISAEYTTIAKRYWHLADVEHKITLRLQPALDTLHDLLEKLKNQQHDLFDFIFIDANKLDYFEYYECSLKLIKKGGIVAIDNTLGAGNSVPYNLNDHSNIAKKLREFNLMLHADTRVAICLLPIASGLTLAYKI